jgi:hypothetical protein
VKETAMKIILAGLLACGVWTAQAQFAGKLTYRIVYPSSTLTMVYYQNGNNARVEAHSFSNADSTVITNVQDTLLFDIAGLNITHLQYQTGRAIIAKTAPTLAKGAMAGLNTQVNIQTIGAENVNGYACTHYVIATQTGQMLSKKDIWVTTSLGTPGIQVAGGYLYYTPDFPQEIKLLAAGGAGVVVKSSISAGKMTSEMNLIGVDTKPPSPRLFTVPGWYTVIDNTQMTMPTH